MVDVCPHCKKGMLKPYKETNPFNWSNANLICPECGFRWCKNSDGSWSGELGELGFLSGKVKMETYNADGTLLFEGYMRS